MDKLRIELGKDSYDILFATNKIDALAEHTLSLHNTKKCCIVTQNNIFKYHGMKLYKSLKKAGYKVSLYILPDGERAKSIEYCGKLYQFLLDRNFDRHSLLLAFGGGVVGDLTGFVAATYMRGLPYVQVPTTLLSSVDSSVGGKTGINFGGVKNIVGSFYQPKVVFIDTSFLKTLSDDEFKSGLGEVIKYAILEDEAFFTKLEENILHLAVNSYELPSIIKKCCMIKSRIVEDDEKELKGSRMLLNLGHTMGHALEILKDFKHGEAVALGIIYACKLSRKLGYLSNENLQRITTLIKNAGLPWQIPVDLDTNLVYELIAKDKKQIHGKINWVLPHGIGDVQIHCLDPN